MTAFSKTRDLMLIFVNLISFSSSKEYWFVSLSGNSVLYNNLHEMFNESNYWNISLVKHRIIVFPQCGNISKEGQIIIN